jgi:hypothetical protein
MKQSNPVPVDRQTTARHDTPPAPSQEGKVTSTFQACHDRRAQRSGKPVYVIDKNHSPSQNQIEDMNNGMVF